MNDCTICHTTAADGTDGACVFCREKLAAIPLHVLARGMDEAAHAFTSDIEIECEGHRIDGVWWYSLDQHQTEGAFIADAEAFLRARDLVEEWPGKPRIVRLKFDRAHLLCSCPAPSVSSVVKKS